MKLLSRLLCMLGMHGPEWYGMGSAADNIRNMRLGSLHRGCTKCNAEWVYDFEEWRQLKPKATVK